MGLPILEHDYAVTIADAGNALTAVCHGQSATMGWWDDLKKITDNEALSEDDRHKIAKYYLASKLMLTVSEVAEGMEGLRKDKVDDHLPQHSMLSVELADAVIRAFDMAGYLGVDLGSIIVDKLQYNATRADHSREARDAEGGKKF